MVIQKYSCPKCKCKVIKPIQKFGTNQIGLYCRNCGAFVKWANKEDRRLIIIEQEEVIVIE